MTASFCSRFRLCDRLRRAEPLLLPARKMVDEEIDELMFPFSWVIDSYVQRRYDNEVVRDSRIRFGFIKTAERIREKAKG